MIANAKPKFIEIITLYDINLISLVFFLHFHRQVIFITLVSVSWCWWHVQFFIHWLRFFVCYKFNLSLFFLTFSIGCTTLIWIFFSYFQILFSIRKEFRAFRLTLFSPSFHQAPFIEKLHEPLIFVRCCYVLLFIFFILIVSVMHRNAWKQGWTRLLSIIFGFVAFYSFHFMFTYASNNKQKQNKAKYQNVRHLDWIEWKFTYFSLAIVRLCCCCCSFLEVCFTFCYRNYVTLKSIHREQYSVNAYIVAVKNITKTKNTEKKIIMNGLFSYNMLCM